MHILPLNNNTSFQGKIITKGKGWNNNIKKAFESNPDVQSLANKHNVIGYLSTKKASPMDIYHVPGENLYQLNLSLCKEKPSLIDRFKTTFKLLPTVEITHYHHSEETFIQKLARKIKADEIKKMLDIK